MAVDTKSAPGTRESAAGTNEEQDQPAGSAAAPDPSGAQRATPTDPDPAASDQQPVETDWRAKYDDTEAKRRDIQSERDQYKNLVAEREQQGQQLDREWRAWIQRYAPDAYAKLAEYEQGRSGEQTAAKATLADSQALILAEHRKGNHDFADYLEPIVEGGSRLDSRTIESHRKNFDRFRGSSNGNSNGNGGSTAEVTTTTKSAAPPRVLGGGAPPVEAPPVWKPGQPLNPRKLIAEGLKNRGK